MVTLYDDTQKNLIQLKYTYLHYILVQKATYQIE